MDQDASVAAGWRDFVAQYWARQPYDGEFFAPPPFDAGALWEVALRAGSESHFSRPDGLVALDGQRYFPQPEDGGFDGYAERLARILPDGGFFQQSNLQSVDVAIYDWAREFLRGLFDALGGMPPARAWLDTMFGHYATTPVGIHYGEPGGVFMFVLAGRKQMLLWPRGTEGIKEDTRSYDAPRASAQVQEGRDGSVCYWPGEWWHVGESPAGPSLSLHVTVHLLRGDDIGWDALEEVDSGYSIDQHLPPTGAAALELASVGHGRVLSQLNSSEARQRAIEAHMRRLSAVCLQKVPRKAPRRPPEPDEVVAVDPRFPILLAETAPGRMTCAANGQMFRIDSSKRLARLVERLNTGEAADVRTLRAEFAATEADSDPLDNDTLLGVLARLTAARALRPVPNGTRQPVDTAAQQSA
jgi:50S ribosomal protein L16 3-hydroxylase